MSSNQRAFLDMLAWSEGTSTIAGSDNGYNVLVGGSLFNGYSDHPRIKVNLGHGLYSTAAGRYQILERYFDVYKKLLDLPDFSPESQDIMALEYVKGCGAVPDIEAGNISAAITKCAHIWASLPSAGYGQHENPLSKLIFIYKDSGGSLAA